MNEKQLAIAPLLLDWRMGNLDDEDFAEAVANLLEWDEEIWIGNTLVSCTKQRVWRDCVAVTVTTSDGEDEDFVYELEK